MIKIKTDDGFECKVNENILRDFRFEKILTKMAKGDVQAGFDALDKLLGEDQVNKLCDHLEEKDKNGEPFTDVEKVFGDFSEIIEKISIDGEPVGKNI